MNQEIEVLPMRDEDIKKIVSFLPSDAILVGGHALILWAATLRLPMFLGENREMISKDMDFFGGDYLLTNIVTQWFSRTVYPSDMVETNLIGSAVSYSKDPVGCRRVDILKAVRGLDTKIFKNRAMGIFYHDRTISVLHPLDLLKARIVNVAEIESKQTQHNADQIGLAITIMNTYLTLRVKQYKRNLDSGVLTSILKDTREVISYALDEQLFKTTRYWRLKILDAIPLDSLKWIVESPEMSRFINVEWPEVASAVEGMRLKRENKELTDKLKSKYKP